MISSDDPDPDQDAIEPGSLLSPLVSVIIPAYNAECTLQRTLESAARGAYRNIEILVIDDGSTDSTFELARDYQRRDNRVRVYRRPNGGLSAAINTGLKWAHGEYVARLDADDLWHPSKLTKQVTFARNNPEIAFIYTFVRYIDANDRVLSDGSPQRFPPWALARSLYESLIGGGSSALIKHSTIDKLGGLDESFRSWEDLLLQLKISETNPIGFVPEYLVGYRVRLGSLSSDPEEMSRAWRSLRKVVKETFPNIPVWVQNWAHGKRCAMFAEAYAWRSDYMRSTIALLEAFWHDPAWTTLFVGCRIRRSIQKRFSFQPYIYQPRPKFSACCPQSKWEERPSRPKPNCQSIRLLEVRRKKVLRVLDRYSVQAM